jgi:hypothetical protein
MKIAKMCLAFLSIANSLFWENGNNVIHYGARAIRIINHLLIIRPSSIIIRLFLFIT